MAWTVTFTHFTCSGRAVNPSPGALSIKPLGIIVYLNSTIIAGQRNEKDVSGIWLSSFSGEKCGSSEAPWSGIGWNTEKELRAFTTRPSGGLLFTFRVRWRPSPQSVLPGTTAVAPGRLCLMLGR